MAGYVLGKKSTIRVEPTMQLSDDSLNVSDCALRRALANQIGN